MTDIQALNTGLNLLSIAMLTGGAIIGILVLSRINRVLAALVAYIARNDERIAAIGNESGEGNNTRVNTLLEAHRADTERVINAINQLKNE